jgi:hypothetical protein
MTYRNLLLAACAGTGILVAFGSVAMPFDAFERNAKSAITLIDDDDDDHDDQREASNDCGDDDDDCGANGSVMQQPQSATPPANGLFAPGSKPAVQMN